MFQNIIRAFLVNCAFFASTQFYRVFSSQCKPKCGVPSKWLPVATNVCHGTKNRNFGTFKMNRDCQLVAFRLSHVSGFQSYLSDDPLNRCRWGYSKDHPARFCTLLIRNNNVWFPKVVDPQHFFYPLSQFGFNDDVIVLKGNETLSVGTEIQVGFCLDYRDPIKFPFADKHEGTHCMDIDVSCME